MMQSADDGLPPGRREIAMAAMVFGNVITSVDALIVNVALPSIARDLNEPAASTVLIVTVYQLLMMMTLLPFSALGERVGLRRMYLSGLVVFLIGALLCFVTYSLPVLIAVRAVQALGASAMMSVSPAMIRSIYPAKSLGKAIAFNSMAGAAIASLAPTLGGIILGYGRWPWLFAILIPFGILSLILGRGTVPNPPVIARPYDMRGALMCAGVFGLTIIGLEAGVHGPSGAVAAGLVGIALVLGVLFVRREARQVGPVFPVDLLRDRLIGLATLGSMLVFMGNMVITIIVPLRMQVQFHYSPAEAGVVMAPWPIMMLAAAPISGWASDRIPTGLLSGTAMLIAMTGGLLLAFLPDAPSQIDVAWRVAVAGFGFSLSYASTARQIIGNAPMPRMAAAGGLTALSTGSGRTLGATAGAALIATGLALQPGAMLVSAGICAVAMVSFFLSLAARKPA